MSAAFHRRLPAPKEKRRRGRIYQRPFPGLICCQPWQRQEKKKKGGSASAVLWGVGFCLTSSRQGKREEGGKRKKQSTGVLRSEAAKQFPAKRGKKSVSRPTRQSPDLGREKGGAQFEGASGQRERGWRRKSERLGHPVASPEGLKGGGGGERKKSLPRIKKCLASSVLVIKEEGGPNSRGPAPGGDRTSSRRSSSNILGSGPGVSPPPGQGTGKEEEEKKKKGHPRTPSLAPSPF